MASKNPILVSLIPWRPGDYLGEKFDRAIVKLLDMGADLDKIEIQYVRDGREGLQIKVPLRGQDPATVALAASMANQTLILDLIVDGDPRCKTCLGQGTFQDSTEGGIWVACDCPANIRIFGPRWINPFPRIRERQETFPWPW